MAVSKPIVSRFGQQVESLLETCLGLGFLVVINLLWFPDDPGFLNVSPHPFLFLTILIASRYGTFDGFVCAILSSMVYIAYLFFGHDLSMVVAAFEWSNLIPVYLFLILGVLLGEIRDMGNREVRKAKAELADLSERFQRLRSDHDALSKVKDELQQHILAAEDPLAQFYESARRLSTLRSEDAYPAVMELVARFTGAEKAGLYLAEEHRPGVAHDGGPLTFRLKVSRGWTAPDEFDTVLDTRNPAVSLAVQRGELVTVRDFGNAVTDILACAPMKDPADSTVLGLLVIERIPFVRLTTLTLNHLWTIAGWAGKTLADARRFDEAMGARVDDETTGAYNYAFLARRLAEECQRVRRYGGVCSFLLVKILEIETLSDEDRQMFLKEMTSVLRRTLRTVDLVANYRLPGVFALVLPGTSQAQAVVVTARIQEAFRQAFGGYGSRFEHLRLKTGASSTVFNEPVGEARLMEEAERFELRQGRPG